MAQPTRGEHAARYLIGQHVDRSAFVAPSTPRGAAGRTCNRDHCTTVLSIYNPDPICGPCKDKDRHVLAPPCPGCSMPMPSTARKGQVYCSKACGHHTRARMRLHGKVPA